MHRALAVQDILHEIFVMHMAVQLPQTVSFPRYGWEFAWEPENLPEKQNDLYHAALTCRTFAPAALDGLWKCMDSLLPLLQLLSPLRTDGLGTCVIGEHISPREHQSFKAYARRIRWMRYTPDSELHSALIYLSDIFPSPLLPRIQVFQWRGVPFDPGVHLFCPSNVKMLDLAVGPGQDSDTALKSVLIDMSNASPSVEHLQLRSERLVACLDEFSSWTDLRSLTLVGSLIILDDDSFRAISQLPSLNKIFVQGGVLNMRMQPVASGFQCLKQVQIRAANAEGITRLLRSLPQGLNTITEIDISLSSSTGESIEHLELLRALHFPRLRTVKLNSALSHVDDAALYTEDALSSLMDCRQFRSLDVMCGHIAFRTTDQAVRKMALAWPRIRRLSWIQRQEPNVIPEDLPTILSFEHFARHCPSLQILGLIVNANVTLPKRPPVFSHNLWKLDMMESIVGEEGIEAGPEALWHLTDVARYLDCLFPAIDTLEVDAYTPWEKVFHIIAACQAVRKDQIIRETRK